MRTDDELKQVAQDIVFGKVFCDFMCLSADDFEMTFMPIALLSTEGLAELKDRLGPKGMVFEYMNKAGPMSHNGTPTFMSLRWLNSEDAEKVRDYMRKYQEAMEAV